MQDKSLAVYKIKNHCQHPYPTTNLLIGQKGQLEGEEKGCLQ